MYYYNIAFDFKNKNEYFYYYTRNEKYDNTYSFISSTKKQKLGSFLIEFLNTNFRNRKKFNKFVTKYCFIDLYSKLLSKELNEISIFSFKFTKEKLQECLDNMYEKYSKDFIYFGEIFRDIANRKSRYKLLSNMFKDANPKASEDFSIKEYNISTKDYWEELENFSDLFDTIYVDFHMRDFWNLYEKNNITNEIPYSFRSSDVLNIIFLSFKHIECYKHPILQCQNCKRLFIPDSAHDIKYCNEIFKNNKTCKQLAPEINYQKTLQDDPILKKYRSRYQSLQKQAIDKPEKYKELYEYYKVEGKKMQQAYKNSFISSKEFQEWIENTKSR